MQLGLQLLPTHVLRLQLSDDAASSSLFTMTEKKLDSNSEAMRALQFIGSRKAMGRYRSIVDFLFCAIYPGWKRSCFAYYNGKSKRRLIHLLPPFYVAKYDIILCAMIDSAIEILKQNDRVSWGWYSQAGLSLIEIVEEQIDARALELEEATKTRVQESFDESGEWSLVRYSSHMTIARRAAA